MGVDNSSIYYCWIEVSDIQKVISGINVQKISQYIPVYHNNYCTYMGFSDYIRYALIILVKYPTSQRCYTFCWLYILYLHLVTSRSRLVYLVGEECPCDITVFNFMSG